MDAPESSPIEDELICYMKDTLYLTVLKRCKPFHMKLLFRICLGLVLLMTSMLSLHAQVIANGDFETWAARQGTEAPTNWLTTDDVVAALLSVRIPTGTYTKVTDAHSGTYALRLESKATLLGPVAPGFVLLGKDLRSIESPGGLPFTGRPAMLQFYYKLTGPQASDPTKGAGAALALTRTVNGEVDTIAVAARFFSTVTSAYTLAQLPLIYRSSATPDSIRVAFSTSGVPSLAGSSTIGTVFQIDDVILTGTATATRAGNAHMAFAVFPNPTAGTATVSYSLPAATDVTAEVLDAVGRLVVISRAGRQAAGSHALMLPALQRGLYTVRLRQGETAAYQKLVVE
jgi:hypothetical protein